MNGLSSIAARERTRQFGPNILVPKRPFAGILRWLKIIADPMVLLLIAAATVYFFMGHFSEAWVLLGAIIPIITIDIALELRTGKALAKIRALTVPTVQVIRDGKEQRISSESLVPGDLLIVSEGDILAADGLLSESNNLQIDESSLTGESNPVAKDHRINQSAMIFAGTTILTGQGRAVVTAIGKSTRYGQIGYKMAAIKQRRTPLQEKMTHLILRLLAWAALACVGLFFIEVWRSSNVGQAFLSGVTLAIAAIPEEFPVVLAMFLTMGVFRLAQKKALVRNIAGVETLGATTVICADKTGTLTTGQLRVEREITFCESALFWQRAVMACEPKPTDLLEKAIATEAAKQGIMPASLFEDWKLVKDYPFDVKRKYMSHVWQHKSGNLVICAKGSVETLASMCKDDEKRLALETSSRQLSESGMRVIGISFSKLDKHSETREADEAQLSPIGLVGFADPPRLEVTEAIASCNAAGIRIIMITGDHPLTAQHIATSIGLTHDPNQIATGTQIEQWNDSELRERITHTNIFARVYPQHKHRIVLALKEQGEIVAMTGDGINDALALKEAHIGVAMGLRGTDVAREASTLVLLDDNFKTIVDAVKEGRRIFSKLQKAFRYLLTFHVPIIALAVAVPLLGFPLLFLPSIVIWVELIMHPTVALVFESDAGDALAMQKPPRNPQDPILSNSILLECIATGLVIASAILGAYIYELKSGNAEHARAVALGILIVSEIFLVTLELSRRNVKAALRNRMFWITRIFNLLTLLLFLYIPTFAQALQLAPLSIKDWIAILALSFTSSFLVEAVLRLGKFRT